MPIHGDQARLDRWSRAVGAMVVIALVYAGLMAPFGVGVLTARALTSSGAFPPWYAGAAMVFILAIAALAISPILDRASVAMADRLMSIGENVWVLGCLSFGAILRLAWVWQFPATPSSDGATYVHLAGAILAGHPYEIDGTRAYWPPGYPLFLAAWIWVFKATHWAIITSNLFLFLLGAIGLMRLADRVLDPAGARFALALYVIWPNLIYQAGMPEKEQVLVALMPWILALAIDKNSRSSQIVGSGFLLGTASLVQPALQYFPLILAMTWYLATGSLRQTGRRCTLLLFGVALIVAPWTIRNYHTFSDIVLISTNVGLNLYGANNEWATGGYLERTPLDFSGLSELDANREARIQAIAWIRKNPTDFLALGFEKNLRFMGDDAVGAYQTFKRGEAPDGKRLYPLFKGLANAYWLIIWGLLVAALLPRRNVRPLPATALALPLSFCYVFALHSIAESAGKYHVLLIALICVMVPLFLRSTARDSTYHSTGPVGQSYLHVARDATGLRSPDQYGESKPSTSRTANGVQP